MMRIQFSLRTLLLAVAVVSVLLSLLMTTVVPARKEAWHVACISHLKQLSVALSNYHDAYGCFPPAYIADENGKPMHSWRVLILPWIDEHDVYNNYNFEEPWDGPHNRLLAALMPSVYKCPLYEGQDPTTTNCVVVVGPQTVWPGSKTTKYQNIPDKPHCTIAIITIPNSDINWMEPRDISFEDAVADRDVDGRLDIMRGCCSYGIHVLFADGRPEMMPQNTPPSLFRSLLTINGGESVNECNKW